MAERLRAPELAERAGCEPGFVERLATLGLLNRADDGFAPGDVHVVRMLSAFDEAGIALEDVARGFEAGVLSYAGIGSYFREPPPFAGTYGELAERVGRPFALVRSLVGAFGLAQPDRDARVRADEAEMIERVLSTWEIVPDEEVLRFARSYGDSLRRVAETGIRFYQGAVTRRLREREEIPLEERQETGQRIGARATDLARDLVAWLHRQHFENELRRFMAESAEDFLDAYGIAQRRPRRPPAIAFLDLTGYTRLTEERGDEEAAALAEAVRLLVESEANEHGGRAVKWLGDGVMFHFDDPAEALAAGIDLVERVPAAGLPPARVGLSAGPVVFRDGDYFGRTVNVAARVADYARPREVLVSAAFAEAAGDAPTVEYEPIGEIPLKGIPDPVPLLRARRR